MDKRLFTLLTFAMVGCVLVAVGTLTAEDTPEEILIKSKGYKRKVYNPLKFAHLTHVEDYGLECNECHHDYKDGKNVWQEGDHVKECVECHNPNRRQGKLPRLVFAFHFNCKKCHKENDSGPIKCKECHTKKKSAG